MAFALCYPRRVTEGDGLLQRRAGNAVDDTSFGGVLEGVHGGGSEFAPEEYESSGELLELMHDARVKIFPGVWLW